MRLTGCVKMRIEIHSRDCKRKRPEIGILVKLCPPEKLVEGVQFAGSAESETGMDAAGIVGL